MAESEKDLTPREYLAHVARWIVKNRRAITSHGAKMQTLRYAIDEAYKNPEGPIKSAYMKDILIMESLYALGFIDGSSDAIGRDGSEPDAKDPVLGVSDQELSVLLGSLVDKPNDV
jgi:hypothetical protein